jgi:glycosyltransferase involved in cell wall biosynthesis
MQTLVVDVRANHNTGVARYGRSVLKALIPHVVAGGIQLVVVTDRDQAGIRHFLPDSTPPGHVLVETCPEREGFVRRSRWVRDTIRSHHPDLFFTTHYTVDRQCPVPFALTIHDLTRLRFPDASYSDESFARQFGKQELALLDDELRALAPWAPPPSDGAQSRFTRYFRALNAHLAERAEQIVTVSRTSASDVHRVLSVPWNRLTVVPGAVDTTAFHRRSPDAVARLKARYGISGPYCLYVGLAHPHKRFCWLLRSLLEHRDALPSDARLVVVGGHGERAPGVREILREFGAQRFVVFTGYVSDDDLATLYSGAAALLIASLSEGCGLPALEALTCGAEVIATDIQGMRETLYGSGHLYQVNDAFAMVELTVQALTGMLSRKAASFVPTTWEDAAIRLAKALGISTPESTLASTHTERPTSRPGC